MTADKAPAAGGEEEISALIETLHETGNRLEQLTGGEVDTVADRSGRTFVLRGAQERLRSNETRKQAAILNALPASIALVDAHGGIVSVNEAWRTFMGTVAPHAPGLRVGLNYLGRCDQAGSDHAAAAGHAAAGIRTVLAGQAKNFLFEYACHSPTEQRWFLMTVVPLDEGGVNGAIVMHLDVSARKRAEQGQHDSELLFRQMAENIREVFFVVDAATNRMLYVSPAYEEVWGRSRESLYASTDVWTQFIHPDDRAAVREKCRRGLAANKFVLEYRMVRPDGSIRILGVSNFPVRDATGKVTRVAGLATDVTERRSAEAALAKRADDLERFHRLSVGRELQMIELKKQINEMAKQAGHAPPYDLAFLGPVAALP
jgi:PAS domain S-box-containing protein